ncbi:hypothetical protein HPC49_37840 [Pyxidicoccus fallax]|uniref:Uncharacterized protein n=1 Tax=Pyxidicoccus fallax TaxID=394095 RepID=A0A848LX90_9BACT|nr:hypothetical protein [Pyxidicoccus fallax]NMO22249.1 hypothetical protein [Pyxidicoccus fallax]NPC83963.1 hypothetical protein [Pyxidicoccus fallax]
MLPLPIVVLALLSTSPAPPDCPKPLEAKERAELEQKAKAAFPSARMPGLRCECYAFNAACPERQWRPGPFETSSLEVKAERVKFRMRPLVNVNMHGKAGLQLVPFRDEAHAAAIARKIRAEPVTAAAFKDASLECDAGGNEPGSVTWIFCARSLPGEAFLPLSEPIGDKGFSVGFFVDLDTPDVVKLSAWSFPANRVPEMAPGWKTARETEPVQQAVAKHPRARVDFYHWHSFLLIVRPSADAKEGAVVKFETPPRWDATEPGPVISATSSLEARY